MNHKETLMNYRLQQAQETILEIDTMIKEKFSTRSIINRSYYAMFYAILALFIKYNIIINTSKHSGIITIFDKEFIKNGIIDITYSKILHKIFNYRLESDYKEFVTIQFDEAIELANKAKEFVNMIQKIIINQS